ncbi:DUF2975 domain-containing protein [Clavibacter zhangzhiyongii]|uniref:DUF2975 domain-containing protein n=1 Tax=Clavibacter zhangzhiyongii TaxID=2768071 RepID=A0A7L7Z427_9MICO|nr:DUF2975 domain-containing protein [Clavibacter zhangzhiyongii]QOD44395.1 DUF2975 domain-containing protein [Clavibacter zhangzhiyongii]
MARVTRIGVKALVALLVALGVAVEALIVAAATGPLRESQADLDGLVVPVAAWVIAVTLCAQAVLVIIWRLTSMTASDAIFDRRAFALVRAMVALGAVATALAVLAFAGLAVAGITPPAVMVALVGIAALCAAFCLVLVTMLGLLRRAAASHAELAEVV